MDATRRRTQNEAMSRVANEAIEEREDANGNSTIDFLCECSRSDCDQLIELSAGEYRRVRDHPRRFIVMPGHESSDLETIVDDRSGYLVVEKRGKAGALAEAEQPRRLDE
jgi:hypothetical protein